MKVNMTEETSRRGVFLAAAGLGAVDLGAALATPGEAAARGVEITLLPASEAVAKFRLTIPAAALVDLPARLGATRLGLWSNRRASTASSQDLTVGLTAEVIS
jgi:hypothetical protein